MNTLLTSKRIIHKKIRNGAVKTAINTTTKQPANQKLYTTSAPLQNKTFLKYSTFKNTQPTTKTLTQSLG